MSEKLLSTTKKPSTWPLHSYSKSCLIFAVKLSFIRTTSRSSIVTKLKVRLKPPSKEKLNCRPADPSLSMLPRSEEHTSELQSREKLVCRLLLEKKKNQ